MESLGVLSSLETRGSGEIDGEPDRTCLVLGEPRVPHNPTPYAHWALVTECRGSWMRGLQVTEGPWSLGADRGTLVSGSPAVGSGH